MKRPVFVFLSGQGLLCLGDALFLTVTSLKVFEITGSGIVAGIGMLITFIPSILVSPFSGLLGDMVDEKRMMIVTDIMRAICSALFMLAGSFSVFFALIMLSAVFDAAYNPPRRKLILNLVERKDVIDLISVMGCISGVVFFVGPAASGWLLDTAGSNVLFLARSAIFLISAILTAFIVKNPMIYTIDPQLSFSYIKHLSIRKALKRAMLFLDLRTGTGIAALSLIMAGFTGLCSNLAFYWLVFDKMAINGKVWGMMLSVYFGSGALASVLLVSFKKRLPVESLKLGYMMIPVFSAVWLLYALAASWNPLAVFLLIFVEGLSYTVFNICALTSLQVNTKTDRMSRVSGIVDFLTGFSKISAVAFSGLIALIGPVYLFPVAAGCSMLFLVFIGGRIYGQRDRSGVII